MKGGDEKTQSHHRRTHEAYDVPAGVPGPPRRPVVAPAGARTRGAGARTADALHDADLVRHQDTPVIALRARAVTAGRDVHPFGSVSTHRGRGEASEGGRGTGGGAERPWLGCRSGRRRCPLRHPSPSRTGTARVAHLGGSPPQRERHPGGGACRRGGEDPLAGRAGDRVGRPFADVVLVLQTDAPVLPVYGRAVHPRHRGAWLRGHGYAVDSPICSNG